MRKRGRKRSLTAPKENREAKHRRDKKRRDAISLRRRDGPSHGLKWRDIADRDNMRCQICGRKVDVNDKWVNECGRWCFGRLYPTIDHIIALANGGTDTYDNVQLACKHCNSKKRDKGQMRLAI
jgi:5-methylcytosine-specific restriction endonuclease McrA